jgi:hypothetical protein
MPRVVIIELPNMTINQSLKGNMPEQNVDHGLNRRLNKGKPWVVRLGLLGVALLLSFALGSAAMDVLVPKLPGRAQGVTARLDWYLHSGQLQADVRTLVAAFQYLAAAEGGTSTVTNGASRAVAGNPAAGLPKT